MVTSRTLCVFDREHGKCGKCHKDKKGCGWGGLSADGRTRVAAPKLQASKQTKGKEKVSTKDSGPSLGSQLLSEHLGALSDYSYLNLW
jgi:hypothetical protein